MCFKSAPMDQNHMLLGLIGSRLITKKFPSFSILGSVFDFDSDLRRDPANRLSDRFANRIQISSLLLIHPSILACGVVNTN